MAGFPRTLLALLVALTAPSQALAQAARGSGMGRIGTVPRAVVPGALSLPNLPLGVPGSIDLPAAPVLPPVVIGQLPSAAVPVQLSASAPGGPSAPQSPQSPQEQARNAAPESAESSPPQKTGESVSASGAATFDGASMRSKGAELAVQVRRWTASAAWSAYRKAVKLRRYRRTVADQKLPPARRAAAARLLGRVGGTADLPVLGPGLRSEDPLVLLEADGAWRKIILRETSALIWESKFMPFPSRRKTAVQALSWLAARKTADAAVDALSHAAVHDFSNEVRLLAIAGLARAKSPAALVSLHWMNAQERNGRMRRVIEAALEASRAREELAGLASHVEPLAQVPPRFSTLAIRAAIVFGYVVAAAELAGGVFTGTLSLKADSLNLFGNRTLDSIALFSLWLARRTPTARWTYGWLKSEALLALGASLGIAAIAFSMIPGAVSLLLHPEPAHGWIVVGFAAMSVLSNLTSAFVLRRHKDVNAGLNGAYHTARADALGTFGLIVAMTLSLLAGVHVFIPISTMVLIAMILMVAWNIFWPAVRTLLDSAPSWVDPEELRSDLLEIPGVAAVFHMHLRALNSVAAELSVKLYVKPGVDPAEVLFAAKDLLRRKQARYKIVQSTIQTEPVTPR